MEEKEINIRNIVDALNKDSENIKLKATICYLDDCICIKTTTLDGKSSCNNYLMNDDKYNLYLTDLFVDKEHRRKGVATLMWKFHIKLCGEFIRNSCLEAKEGTWVESWYEKLGYMVFDDYIIPPAKGNVLMVWP